MNAGGEGWRRLMADARSAQLTKTDAYDNPCDNFQAA